MTDKQFNQEEEQILKLGLNYAYERPLKHFLQDLIMDTENAIKGLFLKLKCFKKVRVLVQFLLVVISHKLHIELK